MPSNASSAWSSPTARITETTNISSAQASTTYPKCYSSRIRKGTRHDGQDHRDHPFLPFRRSVRRSPLVGVLPCVVRSDRGAGAGVEGVQRDSAPPVHLIRCFRRSYSKLKAVREGRPLLSVQFPSRLGSCSPLGSRFRIHGLHLTRSGGFRRRRCVSERIPSFRRRPSWMVLLVEPCPSDGSFASAIGDGKGLLSLDRPPCRRCSSLPDWYGQSCGTSVPDARLDRRPLLGASESNGINYLMSGRESQREI